MEAPIVLEYRYQNCTSAEYQAVANLATFITQTSLRVR
jgi:hypothetical protein